MNALKHPSCLAVLLTCGLLPSFGADPSGPVFTNAADIHHLGREDASLAHPALLRGVVTYSDPRWNLLFVQDSTAGIFVAQAGEAYPTNGEVVEIAGVTGDGSFLPVVTSASWKHLGAAPMPEPHKISSSERFLGEVDCEWAELTGVVRRVVPDLDQHHIEVDIAGAGWRSRAFVAFPAGFNSGQWDNLVDAKIRAVGVCGVDYGDTPGGLRLKAFIPNRSCVSLLLSAPNEPFLSPLLQLEQVRSLLATNPPMHRIRVRGIATYLDGSGLVLQQRKSALRVQGATNGQFKVGEALEAVGFVAAGVFSPVLEDALIRHTPVAGPVQAASAAPATVLWGDYDGRLVALTGVLQSRKESATNHILLLLQDGILFGVSLGATNAHNVWDHLQSGDRLRVTGVCAIQGGPSAAPQSFGVLLRAPGDVVRLPAIHMFSGRQVLAILGIGATAWCLVLLWGVMLRRRVSEQTHELAHSLSLLTAAVESTADGFLVVDRTGRITIYNQVFIRMWNVPREVLERREENCLMPFVATRVKNEEEFRGNLRELCDHPESESFDTLELKDGRVFERYSRPQYLNGGCVGRVWGFRDITARKQAEAKLQAVHQQLLEASRRAGMAEVATSVLHNVGNVLNSVNVSATVVIERLRRLRGDNLSQAAALIEQRMNDLARFLTEDPKGEKLRAYLKELSSILSRENEAIRTEVDSLRRNIEHIKTIVAMQQSYARPAGTPEWLDPRDLMEHALQITGASFETDQIQVLKEYQTVGPIPLDRHRVLQVLINLLSNARHALEATPRTERRVTLSIFATPAKLVCLRVRDNGSGIDPTNLNRIFHQGFTTRPDGHGFGLHSSANAAKEMSGALCVQSDGVGKGAIFTLELPLTASGISTEIP